jgi:hypothetical protein
MRISVLQRLMITALLLTALMLMAKTEMLFIYAAF